MIAVNNSEDSCTATDDHAVVINGVTGEMELHSCGTSGAVELQSSALTGTAQ